MIASTARRLTKEARTRAIMKMRVMQVSEQKNPTRRSFYDLVRALNPDANDDLPLPPRH